MPTRQHISPALAQLRGWVTMICVALALAALVQTVVFAFVQFTDARWVESKPDASVANARVVLPQNVQGLPNGAAAADASKSLRSLGPADATLRGFSRLSSAVGIAAAFTLAVMCYLGVIIAAASSVPGAEQSVNAAVWATIVAMVSAPWAQVLRGEAVPGAFGSYEALTAACADPSAAGGGVALACRFVLLPLFVVVGACIIGWQFRSGVDRGILLTHVSEAEEAIALEMSEIRAKGGGSLAGGTRSVGALNRVLAPEPERPMRMAAGAESLSDSAISPSLLRKPGGQGRQAMSGGDDAPPPGPFMKRPI